MSKLMGVRFSGPLETYAEGFAAELARLGYKAPGGIRPQLAMVAQLSGWLAAGGLEPSRLGSPEVVEEFFAARRTAGYTNHRTVKAVGPLLGYLRGLGVVGPVPVPVLTPAQVLLERYRDYLLRERGLAPSTARGYIHAVRGFVAGREVDGELDLGGLTAVEVTAFVVEACPGQSRGSVRLTVCALRSLLGFLHVDGILKDSLVAAVPTAASWRLARLPQGLSPDEVSRLLAACDQQTVSGRRALSILLLLARLGLRAGEVAGLELDDIDWRAGELVVRGKGQRHERLPLPDDVGTALASYLKHGRPSTAPGRRVFIRIRAPPRAPAHGLPPAPAADAHPTAATPWRTPSPTPPR